VWEAIKNNNESKYKGPERRKCKRIKRQFMARFREEFSDGWDMVTVCNFGAGGVLFNYNKKVELGTIMDFKINFPMAEKSIPCKGKSIRIEEPFKSHVYHIAAEFIEIDRKDSELVNNAAEDFYSKKPGQIEP